MVWMFNHSPIEGHLGGFQCLAITAVKNIHDLRFHFSEICTMAGLCWKPILQSVCVMDTLPPAMHDHPVSLQFHQRWVLF